MVGTYDSVMVDTHDSVMVDTYDLLGGCAKMVAALIPRRTGCVARVSACTATYLQRTEAICQRVCVGVCVYASVCVRLFV